MNSPGNNFLAIAKDNWHLLPNIQSTIFHQFEIIKKVAIKLSIRKWKAERHHQKLQTQNTDNVKSTLQSYLTSSRILACRATSGEGDDEYLFCRILRHTGRLPEPFSPLPDTWPIAVPSKNCTFIEAVLMYFN